MVVVYFQAAITPLSNFSSRSGHKKRKRAIYGAQRAAHLAYATHIIALHTLPRIPHRALLLPRVGLWKNEGGIVGIGV